MGERPIGKRGASPGAARGRRVRRRSVPAWRALVEALVALTPAQRAKQIARMTPADVLRFDAAFEAWYHDAQLPPDGKGWRTWLMQAGRGLGKTRAGAEWVTGLATQHQRPVRIALVGATLDEVRKVMIEGPDGLIAVGARRGRRWTPAWEPDLGRLTWPGGSVAQAYSGASPDGLRGPQHHYAWCDELAKWAAPEAAWANLQMGLRAGERPRALVTTTPRPLPLLKALAASPRTVTTRGRTTDTLNLSKEVEILVETYGGTRLGRQELDGELIEDVEGALWTRETVAACRVAAAEVPALRRVVIGVDPPAGAGTCGIVACGIGEDPATGASIGYVLGDHSVAGMAPGGWAAAVAAAAEAWEAELVVAETNQGGEMVESLLTGADCTLPVRGVWARYGKARRAEPVSALFARGKAKLAGAFADLEDQLCGMTAGGYEGPGGSPDRADAMVWAMAELMLGRKAAPRIMML
jgi:phage terminase large subunit-like protein